MPHIYKVAAQVGVAAALLMSCPALADAISAIQMLPPTPLGSTTACPSGTQQVLSYSGTPQGGAQGGINCVPVTTDAQGDIAANGYIKAGNSSAVCNASLSGAIRFNTSTVAFEGCNGSGWQGLGGSSGLPKSHGVISASVNGFDENGTGIASWCYAQTDANGHPLIYQCTSGTGCWGWGYSTFNQQVFWSGRGKSSYSWYFACSVTAAGLSAAGPNNWSAFAAW